MPSSTSIALRLVLLQDVQAFNWVAQIELAFQEQTDNLSYSRSLQQQHLQISLKSTNCASIVKDEDEDEELMGTVEMLIETRQYGWGAL
ncbi:hypothetical protein KR009_000894, partial [Drosophila setifemur]